MLNTFKIDWYLIRMNFNRFVYWLTLQREKLFFLNITSKSFPLFIRYNLKRAIFKSWSENGSPNFDTEKSRVAPSVNYFNTRSRNGAWAWSTTPGYKQVSQYNPMAQSREVLHSDMLVLLKREFQTIISHRKNFIILFELKRNPNRH